MTDPCPIVGITGISPIRPVSVRFEDGCWCVIDHGGAQTRSLRMPGATVVVRKPIVPVCCWSMAIAEILACRYRDEELPEWATRPGPLHPPMRGGKPCRAARLAGLRFRDDAISVRFDDGEGYR